MRKRRNRTVWQMTPGMTPMELARYQASRLTAAEWNVQLVPVQAAIEALCRGEWEPGNWQPIFDALNRIESMLKLKRMPDHGLIHDGQTAFVSALDRQEATGARAFKAAEMAVIREIGRVYGELLREVTHKDWRDACAHTNANVARIIRARKSVVHTNHCVIELHA